MKKKPKYGASVPASWFGSASLPDLLSLLGRASDSSKKPLK